MTIASASPDILVSAPAQARRSTGDEARDTSFNTAAHGLRGVASLMVFFAHLLGGAAEHVYAQNQSYVASVLPFWHFGIFGVCLFFVISGFVILPSAQRYDVGKFAARRFMRIYPLFLVFSLVFVALNAATNLYPGLNNPTAILTALSFTNLFHGTDQLTPNAWSLSFEVWFYIFTAAAVHFGMRSRNQLGSVVVAVLALLFLLRFPISFYFLGGILVRLAYDRYEWVSAGRNALAEVLALAACIILASRGHYDYHWEDFRNPLVPSLVAAATLYFGFAVSRQSLTSRILNNATIRYFGTVSYSLYLVHPYTYYAVREVFVREHIFTEAVFSSMAVFVLTTAAITAYITHIVHRALERWPYEAVYHQKIYRAASGAQSSWFRFRFR